MRSIPTPQALRRLGKLLIVVTVWTTYVWINRLVNLGYDDRDLAFLVVHFVVAAVSLGLGFAVGWWGWRLARLPVDDQQRETVTRP